VASSGCKKDEQIQPEKLSVLNSGRSVTIQESKAYFEQNFKPLKTRSFVDQNDWQEFDLIWSAADEVNLADSNTVVMVPVVDSSFIVNPYLDAYFVFYEDSATLIRMNALIFQADSSAYPPDSFPTMANFTGLIWEFDFEKDTIGVFNAENGWVIDCGCSNTFMEFAQGVHSGAIQIRTEEPTCEDKGWLGEMFGGIGGFFANVFSSFVKGVWKGISAFFSPTDGAYTWYNNTASMGFVSSGTGAGSFGNGSLGNGGGAGGGTSGGGSGSSFNLSDYFSEWEIKQLQKAAIWMNAKYSTSLSVVGLFAMMDVSCMWEISDFVENSGGPSIDEEDEGPLCALEYYIGAVFGLSEQEIECISGNYSVLTELENIIHNGNVIDVCSPTRQKEEILKEGISNACSNNQINTMNDIYNGFGMDDKIVIFHNLIDFCPVYDCILNEMISGPAGTNFICELFSGFDDNAQQVLQFRPVNFAGSGLNPQALAATAYVESKVQILISISNCSSATPIVAFETLQHEILHADIKRRLLEDFEWQVENETFEDAFFKLVYFEYGPNASFSEHEFMLDFYLDEMIESLIEFNNGVGTEQDFIGLVYFGFPAEVLLYNNISVSQALSIYEDYENFISGPSNINNIITNCD
jgi:hypothetical protein